MNRHQGLEYVYLFIAIIALGFTGWYYATPPNINKISKEALSRLPDAIAYEVHATLFNLKGLPANRFYTPKLTHFPNTSSQFVRPRIVLYPDNGQPWFIQSDSGQSQQNADIITLTDHVILHQEASGNDKAKTITTSEITYYTKKDLATTPKMIFFEQPGLLIKSLGMTAHLKTQQIHLSKQVWSEYIQNEKQDTP